MNQIEFRKKYKSEVPIYKAWGKYVDAIIKKKLKDDDSLSVLKIIVEPRLKDIDMLISKAFTRGKNYDDPYNQITDKVGCRYVVMLLSDIESIESVICNCEDWDFSKDRDFELEIEKNPELFVYQSVHYIVRNKKILKDGKISIPSNTPCEIQIRTLLQHAYSELTHDTTYKSKIPTNPKIKRYIARTMALIETTDNIFMEVMNQINKVENSFENYLSPFRKYIQGFTESGYNKVLNYEVLETFKNKIKDSNEDIESFIDENDFLIEKINENSKKEYLYSQPIIFYLYYLVNNHNSTAKKYWPLNFKYFNDISIDLGIADPD